MKPLLGPDFFIIGAPKCGTTSLDTYLSEHPSIFMAKKEQHFFGSDLAEIWRHPDAGRRPSVDEYFGMFTRSELAVCRGEGSVWYLWSRRAAQEIHEYNPNARIIVMFRNPVEMLPSLHSQYLHDAIEDLENLADALAAESDRRRGQRIPSNNGPDPWRLFYREVVNFHEQLKRYFTIFGRDHVHVVLYDDLAADPGSTYRQVLEFLGVDPTFVPVFRVINPNKRIRSRLLQHTVWNVSDPSSSIRRIGSRLIPVHSARSAMLRHGVPALKRINTSVTGRPPLDPEFRAKLAAELAPDIRTLGHVIGRDLSHWSREPADASYQRRACAGPRSR
jgi:Sulfotransferase family